MKDGGECDLLERLAAEKQFGLSAEDMERVLDPKLYIGRCPQQVDALLEKIRPLLGEAETQNVEIDI